MRVLLVEDEPKVSAFIRRGLEEEGFTVDTAFDGTMGAAAAGAACRKPFAERYSQGQAVARAAKLVLLPGLRATSTKGL